MNNSKIALLRIKRNKSGGFAFCPICERIRERLFLLIVHMKPIITNESNPAMATDLILHKIYELEELKKNKPLHRDHQLINLFDLDDEIIRIPCELFSKITDYLNEKGIIKCSGSSEKITDLSSEERESVFFSADSIEEFREFADSVGIDFTVPELSKVEKEIVRIAKSGLDFEQEVKNNFKPEENRECVSDFSYNPETGDGQFGSKSFRMTDGVNYKKIFDACFAIRGKKLERQEIIKILGMANSTNEKIDLANVLEAIEGEGRRKKSGSEVTITNTINDIVKDIRNKTGLNTKEFVQNSGNITLNI